MSPGHRTSVFESLLRATALLFAGVAAGLIVNALRDEPLSLGPYAPQAYCDVGGAAEPLVADPEAIAAHCALSESVLIVDTRDAAAFARGHVAGATHLPCSAPRLQAERVLDLIGPHRSLVVYGEDTAGALEVARSLAAHAADLELYVIDGGFEAWEGASLACASGPCEHCGEETAHAH